MNINFLHSIKKDQNLGHPLLRSLMTMLCLASNESGRCVVNMEELSTVMMRSRGELTHLINSLGLLGYLDDLAIEQHSFAYLANWPSKHQSSLFATDDSEMMVCQFSEEFMVGGIVGANCFVRYEDRRAGKTSAMEEMVIEDAVGFHVKGREVLQSYVQNADFIRFTQNVILQMEMEMVPYLKAAHSDVFFRVKSNSEINSGMIHKGAKFDLVGIKEMLLEFAQNSNTLSVPWFGQSAVNIGMNLHADRIAQTKFGCNVIHVPGRVVVTDDGNMVDPNKIDYSDVWESAVEISWKIPNAETKKKAVVLAQEIRSKALDKAIYLWGRMSAGNFQNSRLVIPFLVKFNSFVINEIKGAWYINGSLEDALKSGGEENA